MSWGGQVECERLGSGRTFYQSLHDALHDDGSVHVFVSMSDIMMLLTSSQPSKVH
jgi:hypothetical protein